MQAVATKKPYVMGYDEDAPINAFITNLGKYNEGFLIGEWHSFPTTPEALAEVFERIGIDSVRYEEWFITDYETNYNGIEIHEYESIDVINYLANKIDELEEWDVERLQAALEFNGGKSVMDVINLTENDNLDCFDVLSGVHDDYDLGYYWIEESGCYDTKAMGNLSNYIDYASFGRDIGYDECGVFTDKGYVTHRDSITEVFDGINVPEEYRITGIARESVKDRHLNFVCAAAIENALKENGSTRKLANGHFTDTEKTYKEITEKFGVERVNAVLACVADDFKYDDRISNANKMWARGIKKPQHNLNISTPNCVLDRLVDHARNQSAPSKGKPITARIEAHEAAKKAQEKTEPTTQKSKTNNIDL